MNYVEATPELNWVVNGGEPFLDGLLMMDHVASSRAERAPSGEFLVHTTTRIDITATSVKHLHLIKYVLVALALVDLPNKKWVVHHDGGSARMIFTRPNDVLCIEEVRDLKDIIMSLATPRLESRYANG